MIKNELIKLDYSSNDLYKHVWIDFRNNLESLIDELTRLEMFGTINIKKAR